MFSVVIPLYNCARFVPELTQRLIDALSRITQDFEILYINDASTQDDWSQVVLVSASDVRVRGINLSRNFGQHCAISAGLSFATGEWVVVMDGDLQDRPEEIPALYQKAIEGFDIVLAQRIQRRHSVIKRQGSRLFYAVLAYLTDTEQDASVANFGIYHAKVVRAILSMKDYSRYFPTMVKWVGFRSARMPVEHALRPEGTGSYHFHALLRLSFFPSAVHQRKTEEASSPHLYIPMNPGDGSC